jgi:hypothetical protein
MRPWVVLLLASTAIGQPQYKPQPYGNLWQVMRAVALPNSNIIFEVQSKTPKNEMEWRAVENAAAGIEETANLILIPGRLLSNGKPVPVEAADYVKFAEALVPAGRDCLKAARMKSPDAVSNCTDSLSQACDNCHNVYRDKH